MVATLSHTRTLRLRIKDRNAVLRMLKAQAFSVNQVWNYCNELSFKYWERNREFLSAYDMQPYTKGASKELGLHSQTVQAIQEEFALRRKQFNKMKLRWRKSSGARRSLGWIPFKSSAIRPGKGGIQFGGQLLKLWDSYDLSQYQLGPGSISEDSRGRWYLNVTVKVKPCAKHTHRAAIGIDLGLKDFLTTSEGKKIAANQFYRKTEAALAIAQRAGKKQRVRALHAKIKAQRKDVLHKLSTELVLSYGAIFIGNVNAAGLAKTRMAKSVLDAGWGAFRTMLRYKGDYASVWVEEINESFTTQTCSLCGSIEGPKGVAGLGIREWLCSCGAVHNRDVNAAKNILARGHARLAGGIPALKDREDVNNQLSTSACL